MKSLVRNSADPSQVENANRKEKMRGEQAVNDLRVVMGTPNGRRFMRRLIVETAGLYRSIYLNGPTGNASDPVFLEGMRNVGLQQFAEVCEHCPAEWAQAEKEHRDQRQTEGLD